MEIKKIFSTKRIVFLLVFMAMVFIGNKINFSAVPSKILKGQDVTISWTATGNALSCMGSVGWTGTKAKNGAEILKPSQTTIYVLTCGDKSETECVTVNTSV